MAWHCLVVVSCNFQATGSKAGGKVPVTGGQATAAQEACLNRIWEGVKQFVDQRSAEKTGVPRTPDLDWDTAVEKLRVSYTGDVVEKARPLTLEQILPGLPKKEHGGIVSLLDVVSESVREKLLNPASLIREEVLGELPKPRIMAEPGEWPKIARALLERGLVRPVKNVPSLDGQLALNGAFGVVKAGKTTESGKEVLRFIMDLRCTNMVTQVIEGDVRTLSGAPSYQHIVLDDGDLLAISGDDLTAAFYLFSLPPAWSELMVFREKVDYHELGLEGEGSTYLGAAALPMGWHSAVGVMQGLHRQLALRPPERFGAGLSEALEIRRDDIFPEMPEEAMAWTIYLDDTTFLEKVSKRAWSSIKGRPPAEEEALRRAYRWWGIPTNEKKALERVVKAERLGAYLDGAVGTLGGSTSRLLELIGLGSHIRSLPRVTRKQLQVYCGKAVHVIQFRRCMLSYLHHIWKLIAGEAESFVLNRTGGGMR